jgi:tetratricopeptide (TPR) repeat protein
MCKLTYLADYYRYIDKTTWDIINQIDSEDVTCALNTDQINDVSIQKGLTVFAFHHIWNQQNTLLAQQVVNQLLESGDKLFHPFFYFVKSKASHLNGDYPSSLAYLDKAEDSLKAEINGNNDYRMLLTCIGSLRAGDPDGIEWNVMKAIIANDRGNNYQALAQHDKATESFLLALKLQTDAYRTSTHANVAYTHRCAGKSYEESGRPVDAREQYEQAQAIANLIYGDDDSHPEVIAIQTALESPVMRSYTP